MPTTAVPNLLQDPGYLFWAPLASTEPTNTVTASKFTDSWPVAWISLGATEAGSTFNYSSSVEAVRVAEFFDPIKYATTERSGSISFALADWTLNNLKRALNGGAVTLVSGTGATALSKYEPPAPGSEVRAMIGWESLDSTTRIVMRQCIQGGEISSEFVKAPDYAKIACTFNFEFPASAQPFTVYSAGSTRAGS
jgi:hypothetical protein